MPPSEPSSFFDLLLNIVLKRLKRYWQFYFNQEKFINHSIESLSWFSIEMECFSLLFKVEFQNLRSMYETINKLMFYHKSLWKQINVYRYLQMYKSFLYTPKLDLVFNDQIYSSKKLISSRNDIYCIHILIEARTKNVLRKTFSQFYFCTIIYFCV